MKVWLINPYLNMPGEGWREGRSSLLARELAARGHDVTLWTGNIWHRTKQRRSDDWEDRLIQPGYTVRIVPSVDYFKNIGFRRLQYEFVFSGRVSKRAKAEEAPDVIVGNDPPQIVGRCSLALARHYKVPLVLDVVDLWPEFWIGALPKPLRPFEKFFFWPYYFWRKQNLQAADGFLSLATPYMDKVYEVADPARTKPGAISYNGFDLDEFRSHMPEKGIQLRPSGTCKRAVFAGTLGPSYDISAILGAAELTQSRAVPLKWVLAGDGPMRAQVEEAANRLECLEYAGRLSVPDLVRLYQTCDIGLSAYGPFSNVEMPDKFYDYCAAGIPTVNSLTGEVKGVIEAENVGLNYEAGNAEDLLRVVACLAQDEEKWRAMAQSGWNLAGRYDNKVQVPASADLVEGLVRGRG